jgi:hypothetical protein
MIELGFLLEANDLKRNSHDLDQLILKKSSIQTLAKRLPTRPTELVKKDLSLGALISKHLSVVPSPEHPEPADELLYFTGGHITQSYHSNDMQIGLDAIQIELPKHLRFEQKSRDYVIKVLADSLIQMLNTYYIPNSKL